jgi:glucan biosynthesis protein C
MINKSVPRRYDLDWLRVLAFSGVFLYHCSRFFDESYWNIKNATTSPLVDILKGIFDLWGMPLIFIVSGASIFLALRPGQAVRFLRDRIWRLLIPLAFGILVLAPPQVYLDRLTHGEFQGSFLEFLPLCFQDWHLWDGNFAWSGVHLWYLEDLFLFTLVLLPLFAALKRPFGRRITAALARLSARPGAIFLWALPLGLQLILLDPFGILRTSFSEDIIRIIWFPPFLVYGFLVFSDSQIQQTIIDQRRVALALAVMLTLVGALLGDLEDLDVTFWFFSLVMIMGGLLVWSSLLGYGMRYLTSNHRLLSYANEAVLPMYILHQPVILILGYFIIPLPLPILVKYLIIAPSAFGITLGMYEFGIRRLNPVRRVFGLKPRKQALPVVNLAAQPTS